MNRLRFDPSLAWWATVGGLIALNALRILEHEMWRDELQAWRLAVESPSVIALFQNLRWEAHPPLWHLILWPLARLTDDPLAMKALHALIASGIYLLIACATPFSRTEKVLVLLSYFLFFEYWVISRSYAVGVLLAFVFTWLWVSKPRLIVLPWLVLGLMANANVYAAILAVALGCAFLPRDSAAWRRTLPGLAVFLTLFAVAVGSTLRAYPAAQQLVSANLDAEDPLRALQVASWLLSRVFIPIPGEFPERFWPPNYAPALKALAIGPLLLLLVLVLRKERDLLLVFALCLAGVGTFSYVFHGGTMRHWGIVFIAFLCCLWALRARGHGFSWLVALLLTVNAVGGVSAAIATQLRPFSQAGNAARWIEAQRLHEELWIGVPAASASAVAGHLGKPFYYPSCNCRGTFLQWGRHRELPSEELAATIRTFLESEAPSQAFLVLKLETSQAFAEQAASAGLALTPLARFEGAEVENYALYEVAVPRPRVVPVQTSIAPDQNK